MNEGAKKFSTEKRNCQANQVLYHEYLKMVITGNENGEVQLFDMK